VPLLQERYYLVCLKDALEEAPIASLRRLLQTSAWRDRIAALPGYAPWRSGEVLSLKAQLPWWDLPPKRRHQTKSL
jgi:putative molybdopterin biosynthesis protein